MPRRLVVLALVVAASCGKTGPLRPPAPRGPLPPVEVGARQLGSAVVIAFTLPEPRGTAKSQALGRAEVLRVAYPRGVTPPEDPEAFRARGEIVAALHVERAGSGTRMELADQGLGSLADRGVGWTLRYGVRVRDEKGRSSPLVVAHDLQTVAPAPPPAGLAARPTADGIRLTWSAPEGAAEAQFNVYRGPAGGRLAEKPLNLRPLAALEYLDTSAAVGERFRYVVRTVAHGETPYRESESSAPVEIDATDTFPPARPTGLVAVQEGKAVRLLWNPGPEADLDGYAVYRSRGGADWARLTAEPLRQPSYLDADVRPGEAVSYRVTALDRAPTPNESEPSSTSEVRVVEDPGSAGPR